MSSDVVVIACVGSQNPPQMRLAQDDKMIHTLAPHRSDQPFGKAILPGRAWGRRSVPDAHGANSAHDDGAIDSIPIADEVARRLIPGECSVNWRAIHSAVGFVVTWIQTRSRRPRRTMTKA